MVPHRRIASGRERVDDVGGMLMCKVDPGSGSMGGL